VDIGTNTKMFFRHITMHDEKYNKIYDAAYKAYILDKPQKYWSQSNGCLMRCSILALCKSKDAWSDDCKLSNPHPVCVEACELYARCIEGLKKCDYTVIDNYRSFNQPIIDVVQAVLRREKRDVSKNRSWICHGLYFGLWMYKWNDFDTFEDGMRWVIGEHLDSDTDTNACIAGAILGMKLGFNKIMSSKVTRKNFEVILSCKTTRGYKACEIDGFIGKLL
jgi:ADP-ribosylglycohydrolase